MKLNQEYKIRNKVNKTLDYSRISYMKKTHTLERIIITNYSRKRIVICHQKTNISENKTKILEFNGKQRNFYYNLVPNEPRFNSKYKKN